MVHSAEWLEAWWPPITHLLPTMNNMKWTIKYKNIFILVK